MTIRRSLVGMAAVFFCSTLFTYAADTNWGKWGAEDQVGTLNYITPEVIRNAVSLVRKGVIYNRAFPIEPGQPTGPSREGRIYRYMFSTAQGTRQSPGFAEDQLFTPVHGPTHWDGLGHLCGEGKLYNGYDAGTYVTSAGVLRNGIHNVANRMVTRGVLFDIARYKGVKRLTSGYVITVADMEGAARKQGVSFRQGDIVLVRTGITYAWYEEGNKGFLFPRPGGKGWDERLPGIGWGVSQWLKDIHAAAVGVDTVNVEVVPPEPEAGQKIGQPDWDNAIHYELIRNQGMMLLDNAYLDELAEACAADGVYEFLFVGGPLNLINATGSPASPLAIK